MDFLLELQAIKNLPLDALHVILDVKFLHTNIPNDEGIEACRQALNRKAFLQPPTEDLLDVIFPSSFPLFFQLLYIRENFSRLVPIYAFVLFFPFRFIPLYCIVCQRAY